jgi:trk system potassium uptake protein
MRAVFVGASSLAVMTTRLLLGRGHEVVVIEREKARIDTLAEDLDCGFLHGDGSKPALLREGDPSKTNILFCLTDDDETNILSSLVGRSLGYPRVVTRIEDPEYEHLCIELGLEDVIIPARTIGRYLADMFEGRDHMELIAMLKDEARLFSFVAREEDEGPIQDLGLPDEARIMFLYRDDRFKLPESDTKLKKGDEVAVITHSNNLDKLSERWGGSE